MKIARIETFILKAPLGDKTFWSSQGSFDHRKSLVVRIETDEGVAGWGEGGQYGPSEQVAAMIHHAFATMLLGASPLAIQVLWERLYASVRDFGRKGAAIEAMSAIDIALWDIFGKVQKLPIHALLGGAFRTKVKAYATGLYYRGRVPPSLEEDNENLRVEASEYVKQGFSAIKMKIGLFSPRDDIKRIAAARCAVGEDILLMVDANHAYNTPTACWMARAMEKHDIHWFEEPVLPEDLEGYCRVKAASAVAIAGGECEHTRYGFVDWFARRAFDVCQPDVCCAGGISEVSRIVSMASGFHVPCMPHVWGSGIALASALQVLAAMPPCPYTARPSAPYNEPMLEYDSNPNPLRTDLLMEPIQPVGGEVNVPIGPGLGIEVSGEALREYAVAREESQRGR